MIKEETRLKYFTLIELWKKSNKSTIAFCQEHKVVRSSLYYWHKKYKDSQNINRKKEKKFIPVVLKEAESSTLEIVYPNGVKIIVSNRIEHQFLRSLIHLH